MIWSSGANLELPLYYRSPKALDKLRFPLTLPYDTYPPAFVIRFIYF